MFFFSTTPSKDDEVNIECLTGCAGCPKSDEINIPCSNECARYIRSDKINKERSNVVRNRLGVTKLE